MFETDDYAELSAEELGRQARDVASQVSQLQATQVEIARELDARRGREIDGSTSAWLAWQAGLQPGEARRLVSLGRRLPALPRLSAAFADGQLSESTATLLASVATPENEEALLRTSEDATAGQLRTLVGKFRPLARPNDDAESDDEADRDEAPSEIRAWRDESGRLHLTAEFDLADGLDVEQGLAMGRDDARAEAEAGEPVDGLDRVERLRVDDAEAMVRLARSYVAGNVTEEGVAPERHRTIIVSNDEDLVAEARGASGSGPTSLLGGGAAPAWLAAAKACEGCVSALLMDHGQPVLGSVDARFATDSQKVALLVRDGGCQFPGCGATHDLIAHHVVEFEHGGPTELPNLVLLCRNHHNIVHRRRYRLRWRRGRWRFWRSDGTPVPRVLRRGAPRASEPWPDPGDRRTGSGDRLDQFAIDAVLQHWLDDPDPVVAVP